MTADTPFYRVRWTLRARAAAHLHTHQHAILYAVLADAARGDGGGHAHVPDGFLLDAPEVARTALAPGDTFAFGGTLLDADPAQAARRLHALGRGLARLGATPPKRPVALGGNFDLVAVEDLVAGRAVAAADGFAALPRAELVRQHAAVEPLLGRPVTLRFLSPLRLELPDADAAPGHRFADGTHLIAGQLLRAVQKRLAAAGVRRADPDPPFDDGAVSLVENRLVWLDLEYGRRDARKSLGGALGRVRVAVSDPAALAALVWGQYTGVGRNLHFGFGRYRIEEAGPDPTACRRSAPLLDPAAPTDGALQRSFVLRTHGYCKDTSTTTTCGGTVGPLPFRAMPNYPAFGAVPPPPTDAARWHTRPAGGGGR